MKRPQALAACVAAVTAIALAGCSTGSAQDTKETPDAGTTADPNAFPVTIEHAYGETTIKDEPKRVATLGWSDQDTVLSLGVVPIGAVEVTWGGNDNKSTPWFDEKLEKLGGEQPERYSDADGAPVNEINQLAPDLILATNSGITKKEYTRLSKIAPVIAYPDEPWLTPWQTSLEMIGKALGRSSIAAEVEKETQASIDRAAKDNPSVVGASFIFASLTTSDMSKIDFYTPADARPTLLRELGMVDAPIIKELSEEGEFYKTISAERSSELTSDVFITYGEKESDAETFAEDPLLGQIPAIENGHFLVSTDQTDALGLSAPSPLSIPYAMENFVPEIAAAVDGES